MEEGHTDSSRQTREVHKRKTESITPERMPAARSKIEGTVLASGAPHNSLYSLLGDLTEYDQS